MKIDLERIDTKTVIGVLLVLVLIVMAIGFLINERNKRIEEANYLYRKAVHEMAVGLETGNPVKLKSAMDLFDMVSNKGSEDLAVISRLMKARILYEIGKKEEAVKLAREWIGKLDDSNPLKAMFLPLAKDESIFEKFLSNKKAFLTDYALYEYGLILLEKGKKDKAREILNQLQKKYPNSPFSKDLEKLMEVEN